jgi:hypothetical protein
VRLAEELGIGNVFISERWNVKEAATLAGAVGAVSSEIRIAIRGQFDLGADGVILHGGTPSELAPIIEAYRG